MLSTLDLHISKTHNERAKLEASSEISDANLRSLELSDQLIDSRNRAGELETELKRAEEDLELVESRIAKDKQLLSKTSSPKDASGIEHELDTLARRKSDLEDAELAIMERLDEAKAELDQITSLKNQAEEELKVIRESVSGQARDLEAVVLESNQKRSKTLATLDPELVSAYEQKARRGIAVGRLSGTECGACRLSLTATYFSELSSLPSDELPECPNCQAFLVRS
jgi:hypothetical protein